MITPQELQKHIINDAAETAADSSLLSTHETQIDTYDGQGEFTQRFIDSLVAARKASTSVSRALGNTARSAGEGIKSIDPRERIRGISIPEISLPTDRIAAARKKLGSVALTLLMIPAGMGAATLLTQNSLKGDAEVVEQEIEEPVKRQLAHPTSEVMVETTSTTQTPEEVEVLPILDVQPRESFLTPEGNLVSPDTILRIDSIGSTIYGFMRPIGEADKVGTAANATPIDVVVPAIEPQIITPQLEEYARNNPEFTPTYERGTVKGKKNYYWNGLPASSFQKTAMQEYGSTLSPGQEGVNSVFLMHASTWSVGGGDLPAMKAGDQLNIETPHDGNIYSYEFVESEIIDVDSEGNLTPQEIEKQVAKGHTPDITAQDVIYNWVGHEDETTVTIQICGDESGIPGGVNGANAAEARIIYRFKLNENPTASIIKTLYENLPDLLKNSYKNN